MKRKLLLLLFISFSISYGQFNQNAPWMKELRKKKGAISLSKGAPTKQTYTFKEITDAFDNYWIGKNKDAKGSGYKPFMRWRNYWKHFVKADGTLPTAAEQWQTWENFTNSAGPVNPTSDWNIVGPIINGELNGATPGIGRINAVTVDPNNPNIWYAGAPAGGIWKSVDAGLTWTSLFDQFPQIGVSGIAVDPNNSNTILIATGDDDASDSFSAGVFKSTDGGASWTETSINPSTQNEFDVLNEIVYDPTDSNIVWAAGSDGLQKSTDSGDNWTEVLAGNITDFKLKPEDPNTIYAVAGETGAEPNGPSATYYKSADGGASFTQITSTLPTNGGRMVLAVSPAAPELLYICAADVISRDSDFLGLFKSTDSGETFTRTAETDDIFGSSQAWFDFALEVSPTNPDELYVGVLDVWRSTDCGDDFIKISDWRFNDASYTHADIHTLKFFNDRLYCGSDGGLYVSDDGINFTDYSDGLAVTQFYRIGIAKNNSEIIVGGTQDNSGFVYNNNEWNTYTGGDGMDYEVDPTNGNIAYGFTQFGGVLFITNNLGQSAGIVSAPTDENDNAIQGNWITPLTVTPEGEVYSAYDIVYKLTENGWEGISNLFIEDIDQGNRINDLEADPNNPQVLYASDRGFLFRSENGGETFVTVNPNDPLDDSISDIAINSENPDIIYVTTSLRPGISQASQPDAKGVYRLNLDNGALVSIDNLTLDLPTDQAYFCIVHQSRNSNNPIYVGTSLGVYRLDDTLTEWEQYSTGLPNTAVSDLEISPDDEVLVASTYGRGAWQTLIPVQQVDDDIKLVSINTNMGSSVLSCDGTTPSITVENNGLNAITQVTIQYILNDNAMEETTFNGTIASGETSAISLPELTLNLGLNTLEVTTIVNNDAFADNNTQEISFGFNEEGAADELFDMETEATALFGANTTGVTPIGGASLWERGVPTGTLLNTASSGTQVYGTNLDGDHGNNTTAILFSRCYDFSSILAPALSFQMGFELEDNWDVVYVIYSTDNFENFEVLGSVDSQPNWYNSDRTNASSGGADCFNCPGAQWTGTDPTNATMTEYAYDFTANAGRGEVDLTNETNIQFGIVFVSDQAVFEEGAIVDDFVVKGFFDDDDDDDDGILDVDDNCPLVANADQLNTDGDSEGDACDDDDDNDGVLDIDDNCPLTANADQADFDGDGIGDVCDDDIDGDGVPNALDVCDETPADTIVDVDGCPIFTLPATNFSLKTTGESCSENNNGAIEISGVEALNYTARLTDAADNTTESQFFDTTTFTDLSAGDYVVCVTIESQPGYEICFNATVTEPDALNVGSKVSSLKDEVTLSLSGGKEYLIELNGLAHITSESEITLPLSKIENILTVRTDKDCQGIYSETIVLSDKIFIYPNPNTNGELNVYLGSSEFEAVDMSIFTTTGSKVYSKPFRPENGYVKMNVSSLPEGIYLLNIKTTHSLLNYKIIMR